MGEMWGGYMLFILFLWSNLYRCLWLFIISRFIYGDDKTELRSPNIIQEFDVLAAFLIEMCQPISCLLRLTWGVWDPLLFSHINVVPNSLASMWTPSYSFSVAEDLSGACLPHRGKGQDCYPLLCT